MDSTKKLITGLFALFCFTDGYAYTLAGTDAYSNLKVIDGDLHIQRPGGGTSILYPDIKADKVIPVNSTKGNFLVPVPRDFPIELSKVGKAAVRFAKVVPMVSAGFAIYDTICDLTSICRDENGMVTKTTLGYTLLDTTATASCTLPQGISFKPVGSAFVEYAMYPSHVHEGGPNLSSSYTLASYCPRPAGKFDALWQRNNPVSDLPPSTKVPVTETDWTNAESQLNTPAVAQTLYENDAPVPVSTGTQLAPIEKVVGSSTVQVRDSGGNVTGTQTTTTTVMIIDNSTTTNIQYNITEKTLVEDFDANNQRIGSKETRADNEPPKKDPPEDIKIENGKVDEVPLLTETVNVQNELDNAQQAEWSVYGSCPADIDLGVYDLEFSLTPFCTFAENMRPIVLMLGAFFSFLILSGAKFN